MTGATSKSMRPAPHHENEASQAYFEHSSAPRVNTDAVIVEALRREYPQLHLTVTPKDYCDLLSYAGAGHAAVAPIDKEQDRLSWMVYQPAVRRMNGGSDGLAEFVHFGKFLFEWHGKEYVLFIADGRDGSSAYPSIINQYILSSSAQATERLLLEAGRWTHDLHDEVWVFDQGRWQKSAELYESVQAAEWENVILDEGMKKALIRDVDSFFSGQDTYKKLKVPWKRGVIYYGPPGNGKTISIKATMHTLYKRKDPVPTLYVKTLSSFAGPEYSIRQIFAQARKYAPCYLVFEDLDSLITPGVRSYFLNEVDGLKNNDGILMVGSTNHLDQLDPGIAKRPSRFDRKYFFPDPDEPQRVAYAKFWQGKLADNEDIAFPDEICDGMARITDGFSFAYMQEAFVAALLSLAGRKAHGEEEEAFESPSYVQKPDPSHPPKFVISKRPETTRTAWDNGVTYLKSCTDFERDPDYQYRGLVYSSKDMDALAHTIRGWADVTQVLDDNSGSLDEFPLWRELKRQVKILKEEMDRDSVENASADRIAGRMGNMSI